ncbi:hypothetical protein [Kitasatospora sp. NPDC050543]|uniref:hypothetical protein n=1 Tax=Kitasatospora sp. NPDC050543 TaxID=3364054 RepID=UPI0037BB4611
MNKQITARAAAASLALAAVLALGGTAPASAAPRTTALAQGAHSTSVADSSASSTPSWARSPR